MFRKKDTDNTRDSVNINILSTLWTMKYEKGKIERTTMDIVGFNNKPNVMVGKVVMSYSMRVKMTHSTLMVVDTKLAYNAIL